MLVAGAFQAKWDHLWGTYARLGEYHAAVSSALQEVWQSNSSAAAQQGRRRWCSAAMMHRPQAQAAAALWSQSMR
jgi:hypothetical protein